MFFKRMFWCCCLVLLQCLCGIALAHDGNAKEIEESEQTRGRNSVHPSVIRIDESSWSSLHTPHLVNHGPSSTIENAASVEESATSYVYYAAKSERTITPSALPNTEADDLDSYLLKTISISTKSQFLESFPVSSPSSSAALTVDSLSHRVEPEPSSHPSSSSQVNLTSSPSISRIVDSSSSFPSEFIVTAIEQQSTQSVTPPIYNGEEMTMAAAENSEIVFSTYNDLLMNTAIDYDSDDSPNFAQNNRTPIRLLTDRNPKDSITLPLNHSEYVLTSQNPLGIQSSYSSTLSTSIPKTARELLATETPNLSYRKYSDVEISKNGPESIHNLEGDLSDAADLEEYLSSPYVSPQTHISSTMLAHRSAADVEQAAAVGMPSKGFPAESNPQHGVFFESDKSSAQVEDKSGDSITSEVLKSKIYDVGMGMSPSQTHTPSVFQKRDGLIFAGPESEDDEPDIHLEGSIEDSEKNVDTQNKFHFSSTALLRDSFTPFPSSSSSRIGSAAEVPLQIEPAITEPNTTIVLEKRSDSGEDYHSSPHSRPSFMYLKHVPEESKINIGKSNITKSDFLIVVSPSPQRTSKEIVLRTDDPPPTLNGEESSPTQDKEEESPTLNEDEVSKIVSILTANLPDLSTEEIQSSESVLQGDVSQSTSMKNKTSRDDAPHFDDIISGIIQLLAGDVHVVRPPPNFHLAHPPVPRPPRPTSSRINNRGPPALFPPSKTVVVFSQPPHHVNVRPRPPPPHPLPPLRPRPTLTRINHFQTAPSVTHIINVLPTRPDKAVTPTSSVIHLYKPLLNPIESENSGHLSGDKDTVISVLKSVPMLSANSARPNTVLSDSPSDGLIESTKKVPNAGAPQVDNAEREPDVTLSHTTSESPLSSVTEDSSGPYVYDDYYDDVSESEESREETVTSTNSDTFEILQDFPVENVQNFSHAETNNANIFSSLHSQDKAQAASSNQGPVPTPLSSDKSPGDKYLYVSTKVLPKGSDMPSGPITDWVPFFERPATKPLTGSIKDRDSAKAPEIIIITEPTMFDLTVTNALTGILSPSSNSSELREITPSGTLHIQNTRLANIVDTETLQTSSLSTSKLIMTTVLPSYHYVTTPVLDKEIRATLKMDPKPSPSPAVRQPYQTASLSPSEPEIVYGRPPSSQEKPVSPLRVDNLSKYRHNSPPSDTFVKTDLPFSGTIAAETVTLVGRASVRPKVEPSSVNITSTSTLSTSTHQPQQSTGGAPLLGRPIVVPVDIEEVRPYVGAINPPRQGSRPSLNAGQRPPPGFPGPPLLGSGNVQVAQAGVNVAEDTRGRPSAIRPSPPLIRTNPRLRTNTPLVRIDTCIVGDDSTCDLQMNETCKTEHGVSSCQCRPGFSRSFSRGPCQPIVSVMLSLKVDRFGDQRISFNPRYQDPNSEEYRLMEFEAKQAISSMFSYTAFSRNFVSATVNKFYSIGGRLIINATIQLEEKESTRVQSLRLQMRQEVVQAINSRAQNIGDSRLYVEGPLNPVPAVEDVNECTDSALNDCSENGYCQNVFGTYLCKCKVGYLDSHPYDERKSGRKCSACSVDFCSNHGHCFVDNGQKLCRCRGNYIGSRCEIDSEVLGVALGASLAAIIIIVLTLVCLCVWNRRWKREQQKTEAMSARSVNSAQTYSYLNKMSNLNTYRLTMEDRMRWAHIADVVGNVYVQPEAGATPMQTAMVQGNQSAYPTMNRCHSPNSDDATWYGYNTTTRPRSRAANCHNQSQVNGGFYDTDFSTRETYVGPGYAPMSRFVTPNVMRNYYS